MAKMPFAEDNHVIKAVPPDRTDQPLRVSILPRRPRRTRAVPYAHRPKASDEGLAVCPVSISDEISRCLVPATRFCQLTGNPFGARIALDAARGRLSRWSAASSVGGLTLAPSPTVDDIY